MKFVLAVLLAVAVSGCATQATVQARQDQKDAFNQQMAVTQVDQQAKVALASAAMATCSSDANPGLCVAMALDTFNEGASKGLPQLPVPPVHPGWRIADTVLRGTLALAPGYWGYKTVQSNNDMWSDIITGVAESGRDTTPDYQIGGDYISGTQDNSTDSSGSAGGNIGDTFGDDTTGGDRLDNSGLLNNGDDNRFDSPGPFDDVANCDTAPGTGNSGAATGGCGGWTSPLPSGG